MKANFSITNEIAKRLAVALAAAGHGDVDLRINPDHDENDTGDVVDDEIGFFLADGTDSDFRIQCGPYGLALTSNISESGEFVGVMHYADFEAYQMDETVKAAVEKFAETSAPTAPAP